MGFLEDDLDERLRVKRAQEPLEACLDITSYPLLGAMDHASFCQKKLKDLGLEDTYFVDVATDRTIQLDIDIPYTDPLPARFYDGLAIFARRLDDVCALDSPAGKTASYRKLQSRNGRTHVSITLNWDMPQAERIAWQAVLGSDFKREALSLAYAAQGQQSPVLLYSRIAEEAIYVPIVPTGQV